MPNHSDTIHVDKVIKIIKESYNQQYILKERELIIDVDHDFPYHTLSINNQVLYHVIDNLINNALKYAEKQISIKFEVINEHLLNFTITNDGILPKNGGQKVKNQMGLVLVCILLILCFNNIIVNLF